MGDSPGLIKTRNSRTRGSLSRTARLSLGRIKRLLSTNDSAQEKKGLVKTLGKLKDKDVPVPYDEYIEEPLFTEIKAGIAARKFDVPQQYIMYSDQAESITGGRTANKEDYVALKTPGIKENFLGGAFGGALSGKKKSYVKVEKARLDIYAEDPYLSRSEDEALLQTIPFVEIRAISYENVTNKEFTITYNAVLDEGTQAKLYMTKSTVFTLPSSTETHDWLKNILQGIRNTIRFLQAITDNLIDAKETEHREHVENFLRQIVDLSSLAKGRYHQDTIYTMEQLSKFLVLSEKKGEAKFWEKRAAEMAKKTKEEMDSPTGLDVLSEELDVELDEKPVSQRVIRQEPKEMKGIGGKRVSVMRIPSNNVPTSGPSSEPSGAKTVKTSPTTNGGELPENMRCVLVHNVDGTLISKWTTENPAKPIAFYVPGVSAGAHKMNGDNDRTFAVAKAGNNMFRQFVGGLMKFCKQAARDKADVVFCSNIAKEFKYLVYGLHNGRELVSVEHDRPIRLNDFTHLALISSLSRVFQGVGGCDKDRFIRLGKAGGAVEKL